MKSVEQLLWGVAGAVTFLLVGGLLWGLSIVYKAFAILVGWTHL